MVKVIQQMKINGKYELKTVKKYTCLHNVEK